MRSSHSSKSCIRLRQTNKIDHENENENENEAKTRIRLITSGQGDKYSLTQKLWRGDCKPSKQSKS